MADFSNLSKLRVKSDATAEFVFYSIAGEPTLSVAHAGDTNPEFLNAVLRQPKKLKRARRRARKISQEAIAEARAEDVRLFSQVIVKGWSGVVDADGNEVDFAPEVCAQFLEAIPSDMFNELRAFCVDIENFREVPDDIDDEELEDLQGN